MSLWSSYVSSVKIKTFIFSNYLTLALLLIAPTCWIIFMRFKSYQANIWETNSLFNTNHSYSHNGSNWYGIGIMVMQHLCSEHSKQFQVYLGLWNFFSIVTHTFTLPGLYQGQFVSLQHTDWRSQRSIHPFFLLLEKLLETRHLLQSQCCLKSRFILEEG